MHHRSEQARRGPWRQLRCLRLAGRRTALLAARLVEPCLHHHPVEAPMLHAIDLAEVHVREDIVASCRHLADLASPSASSLFVKSLLPLARVAQAFFLEPK